MRGLIEKFVFDFNLAFIVLSFPHWQYGVGRYY